MFQLYGTEGCHLCELALKLCNDVLEPGSFKEIDIIDDEALLALYRVHIPVLENMNNGQKLFWPFSVEDIIKIKN